jgi:hypothetical protein
VKKPLESRVTGDQAAQLDLRQHRKRAGILGVDECCGEAVAHQPAFPKAVARPRLRNEFARRVHDPDRTSHDREKPSVGGPALPMTCVAIIMRHLDDAAILAGSSCGNVSKGWTASRKPMIVVGSWVIFLVL